MNRLEWQAMCLAQLGITRWEPRAPRRLGVVIADGLTLPLPAPASQLLEAMLRALQIPRSQVQVVTAAQALEAVTWVWVLGDKPLESDSVTVHTVGLQAILADATLKKAVWQALQGLLGEIKRQ